MKINVVIIVPKAEELIEISSRKIAIKQKELNRKLTNDEKSKIDEERYVVMRYKTINKNHRLMSRSMIFLYYRKVLFIENV